MAILFPQDQLRHVPASVLSQLLPPNIPSVDLTRSQGLIQYTDIPGSVRSSLPYYVQRNMFYIN
jgi:hypothetical protein